MGEFFPDVVKNVVVKSIEIKKMVYIYLVHYADFNDYCREIALLSINSFQKDLAGSNQLIRGLALRVMTSIRVPDIIQLQVMAVRKCSSDVSPYVRRCAAVALAKIHSLDASQDEELIEIMEKLLGDSSTMVLGSAVAALVEIDPNRFDIMHACFRKLCHLLADLDEWTQVAVLSMMKRYVRNQFVDPIRGRRVAAINAVPTKFSTAGLRPTPAPVLKTGFYSDDSDSDSGKDRRSARDRHNIKVAAPPSSGPEQGSVFVGKEVAIDFDTSLDSDHRLVLSSSLALLKSRNSAVVLAACALHFYCGVIVPNSATTVRISKAMVRILRSRREIQFAVLTSIKSMVIEAPWMFSDFVQEFYIKSDDPLFNRKIKLDILAALCTKDNSVALCRELQSYVKESNNAFVVASVQTVAKVAERNTDLLDTVLTGLLTLFVCHQNGEVHGACAVALRHLLQIGFSISSPGSATVAESMDFLELADEKKRKKHKKHKHKETTKATDPKLRQLRTHCEDTLRQVFRLLFVRENAITSSVARANLIWLAGEYYSVFHLIAKDILRLLAVDFKDEESITKKEILTLAVKYSMRDPTDTEMEDLMTYVLELSRYDLSTDVRDLARLMTAMCGLASGDDTGDMLSSDGRGNVNAEALEDLSQRASRIMLAIKEPPRIVLNSANSVYAAAMWDGDDSVSKMLFLIDSISSLTGYSVPGYCVLSPWAEKQPDSSVRDKIVGSSIDSMDKGYATKDSNNQPWMSSALSQGKDDSNFYDDDDESSDHKKTSKVQSRRSRRDSSSSEGTSSDSSESDSGSKTDSSGPNQRRSRSNIGNRHIMDPRPTSSSSSSGESDGDSSSDTSEEPHPRDIGKNTSLKSQPIVAAADMNTLSGGNVAHRAGLRRVVPVANASNAEATNSNRSIADSTISYKPGSTNLLDDMYDDYSQVLNKRNEPSNVPTTSRNTNVSLLDDFETEPARSGVYPAITSDVVRLRPPAAEITDDSNILAQILDSFPAVQVSTDSRTNATSQGKEPVSVMPTGSILAEVVTGAKILLNPDLSAGLSISLSFRHGIKTSVIQGTGAKSALLNFKNCGEDYAVRRVRLGLPGDIKRTSIEDIAKLTPGESVVLPLEIMTSGLPGASIKFDVSSDRGTYKGSLSLDPWDTITPAPMSIEHFEEAKKRLRGFSETTSSGCRIRSGGAGKGGLLRTAASKLRYFVDMFVLPEDEELARLSGSCVLKSSRGGPLNECMVLLTIAMER